MAHVLERGDVSFFWKPSVLPADAPPGTMTTAGVQSFFLVLSTGDRHRRLRVGKKRLPAPTGVGSLADVLAA